MHALHGSFYKGRMPLSLNEHASPNVTASPADVLWMCCSLELEGKGANRRRRTRHQHFWRNTDKLDNRERVYIPTSSIRPALSNNEPVVPKMDIRPDERTNAWTVCLTTQGVVSYLNKRISPLGKPLSVPNASPSDCCGRGHVS